MSSDMTTVLPAPVAIFKAMRNSPSFSELAYLASVVWK